MPEHISYLQYILGAFIGVGLAAASGFRVFMPLFAVSLASYLGWIPINESWQWLAGLPTLIATGIAMIVEILAYYIPFIDHLLDTINIPLATIAGTLLFASQFTHLGAFPQWALALIAGGGTASVISSGFAGLRATSTATTGGTGNFMVASTETVGGSLMSVLALAAPIIAFIITILLIFLSIRYGKKDLEKNKAIQKP
ncbi:membrane protein [Elizabethkingia anophelis]|nr:membrane protein [Elizabethkingia anophelis]